MYRKWTRMPGRETLFRGRPIIQSKNTGNYIGKLGRNGDRSGAASIGNLFRFVGAKSNSEGPAQIRNCTG